MIVRPVLVFIVCIALAALTGCATTSANAPSLFVLDAGPPASDAAPDSNAPTLVVLPVATADYLDQGGIVYQTGPHRVVVANDNRWASPLSGQLTAALYGTLASKLAGMNVERDNSTQKHNYQLRTRVDSFLGNYDGSAHIAGRWTLIGPDGKTVTSRSFERKKALETDGYPALVSSLSDGWQQIGQQIANTIGRSIGKPDKR